MPDAVAPEASAAPSRVGLISLGCPKNLVDSERMLGQIAADNPIVSDLDSADVASSARTTGGTPCSAGSSD